MPKNKTIKKVLVIGSGPIVIGQAAEFDYAGTQACLTLKAEGCEVILLNNNPATIMTDEPTCDKVYFEPLTVENVEKIIQKEKPDSLLASVSGQTGLNLAQKLAAQGILEKYDVNLLGTSIEAIMKGEDREQFRRLMQALDEPIPESEIVESLASAQAFLEKVDLPIIIRPAYTLGGSGGGIATTEAEFIKYVTSGLRASPIHQCLIEKSIAGWQEIEFEVVADKKSQAVVVCHMENIDPVGIHTGDSMVVAPIQTLDTSQIEKLKTASFRIAKAIGIEGACNVQLAFNPDTEAYIVIEVNPRVSRSSALASKATGYPIAKIATKIALGYTLDELTHANFKVTLDQFEPALDYTVVKFPCWPFEKFTDADRKLGTQMKATGEVMAIEKNVRAGLQKALRSLELELDGLKSEKMMAKSEDDLEGLLISADDRRILALCEAFRRGYTVASVKALTGIDEFFLNEIKTLVDLERQATEASLDTLSDALLFELKVSGFTNETIAGLVGAKAEAVADKLAQADIHLHYEKIIAYAEVANEDAAYYYANWQTKRPKKVPTSKNKVLIIGSGPIKIGQGIEFDYCSVKGVKALQKYGYETIMINNNPATVSTDYEVADRLYFEPITAEDVLHVLAYEGINQAIVQYGGQTAINLVAELEAAGVELLGSAMETIDILEDRERFYQFLQKLELAHIPGDTAHSSDELAAKVEVMGYPILLRPSYVIGGKGMAIIRNEAELATYELKYLSSEKAYPILLDAYYPGNEIEVDVVTDGKNIVVPAIFEHIEKAGVHSGDSMAVTPPMTLTKAEKAKVVEIAGEIARNIDFKGIFNIQYVIYQGEIHVLEVNPRASRTVPIVSKVTGLPILELATSALLHEGSVLKNYREAPIESDFYTVKLPVYSNIKLPGVDPMLVPEMKSTGEVIAMASKLEDSFAHAFLWNEALQTQFKQAQKTIYMKSFDSHFLKVAERLAGFSIETCYEIADEEAWLKSEQAFAVFDNSKDSSFRKRAIECQVNVFTREETLRAFSMMSQVDLPVQALQDKITKQKVVILS